MGQAGLETLLRWFSVSCWAAHVVGWVCPVQPVQQLEAACLVLHGEGAQQTPVVMCCRQGKWLLNRSSANRCSMCNVWPPWMQGISPSLYNDLSSSKNLCCRYLLQSLFIWLWHVVIQFIIAYISCFGKSSTFVLQWQQQQQKVSHKLLMQIRLRCRAEILGKSKCIFAPLTIGIWTVWACLYECFMKSTVF